MTPIHYPALLLCCGLLQACTDDHTNSPIPSLATSSTQTEKKHGIGKQELSCDMGYLTIVHGAETRKVRLNELLNQTGIEVAYNDDRRWHEEPAISLASLVSDTTTSTQVILFSCDETENHQLDIAEIRQSPKRYILMKNKADRLRLAEFSEQRRRYHTRVKNLVRIEVR